MSDQPEKSSVFAELTRRHVFRSMAAYVVVAWLLVQVADTILPIYDAPGWILRAFVTVLILGFTPAIILSWLYNITRHGIETTSDRETRARILTTRWFRGTAGAVTVVLTGIALWWVWTDYLVEADAAKSTANRPPANPVVAVATIRNLSGKPDLDWLGEGLANLVRTDLARSRHVVVVSKSRWDSIRRLADDEDDVLDEAQAAGIQYVYSGEFISAPSGLFLAVRLSDLASGTEVAAESFDSLQPETMLGNGYRLAILARQGLRIPHTESVDSFAADFIVNNMTAYEAYVGGLEFFRRFEYGEAEQAFSAALELASDFSIARYRLAHVYMSTGRQTEAVETIAPIAGDSSLDRREQLYVDAAAALFEYELDTAIARYLELLDEYPYEVEARQFLAEAYFQNFQDDKAIEQLGILARQEPENEFVWGSMGTYMVLSGRLDEAGEPLQKYLELAAEKAHPLTMLGDLHRQRGDYDGAKEYYARALEANAQFAEARRGLAQVLTILGDTQGAIGIWRSILANESEQADERIYAAFDLASVLRARGRFRESQEPLVELESEIREERIRESMALGVRAQSQMELGNVDDARELIALALERNTSPAPTRYLFARGLLEVNTGAWDRVLQTAAEIREHALPPDNPDRTEERAAAYLEGRALAGRGDLSAAIDKLREALSFEGYDYALYELGLARALVSAGQLEEASRYAEIAAAKRYPGEIRLDLELDRVRAGLLQAQIQEQLGNVDDARRLADDFLTAWADADQPSAAIELAQSLAGR